MKLCTRIHCKTDLFFDQKLEVRFQQEEALLWAHGHRIGSPFKLVEFPTVQQARKQ